MRTIPYGATGIAISDLCLGTMTWGTQTPPADAHRQMDMALAAGINIVDTAEMYPTTPPSRETIGVTESILGAWNAANPARRGDYLLATKILGPGGLAGEGHLITGATLRRHIEDSLARLRTDVIDIYQLHWPNRGSYHFRQGWTFDPRRQGARSAILGNIADVLEEAGRLATEGKLRFLALSNESVWGTAQWLRLAGDAGAPRVQSVQNEYSLLCRQFDTDWAEMSHHEQVTLLSFSPLAAGLLTGKYSGGAVPDGSRMSINPTLGGRLTDRVFPAVAAYAEVACRHGLSLPQMALAWQRSRPFGISAIFGATTSAQLEHLLGAADLDLSEEVLAAIDTVHKAHPAPY